MPMKNKQVEKFVAQVKGTRFWTFRQNNSGGSFDQNETVSTFVIMEALDADDANCRAREIGIYFNGVEDGIDCDCCGDRWYPAYEEGFKNPEVYGKLLEKHKQDVVGGNTIVYYIDGRKEISLV